jgi:hypothetical protein
MKKMNSCEVTIPANRASARVVTTRRPTRNARQELSEVRLPGVLLGRIASIRESGEPLVDFPGNTSGELVPARSLIPITTTDAGREVALTFEDGDSVKPIIAGLLQVLPSPSPGQRDVKLDNESLHLTARKEVVIQCGKASITLTSAGKVLIRGAYLLSRSSGVNRIKGGSVQIN